MDNPSVSALENQIEQEIDFEKINELCGHITDAIKEMLDSCGLYFRIFSRVKAVDSIASKLARGKYGTSENPKKIQDLIGIRVVLYYYDDMRICRDIMESTFQMVDGWSKNNFNSDEFRATKINGVFQYPSEYFNLYKKNLWTLPIDTTFEIQFRTVFFEGWHEIEHDMRYKSILSDDQFWEGSEELSRMLNCILASLELNDWSLVQLFKQLSANHLERGNWELMLKSHYRIRFDENSKLHPGIIAIFDRDRELASRFKTSRLTLIKQLLTLDHPKIDYNTAIQLLNDKVVHNKEIAEICNSITEPSNENVYQKTTLSRLESNILFHLELPLLHKETRELKAEFNNAANIVYKWAKFKLNPVYEDMPDETSSYKNKLPGYSLKIKYDPDNLSISMKMNYIDAKLPGTLWHVHTSIARLDDGQLHLYHMTSRDMQRGATQKNTFLKPSFLADLSNKVGLMDVERLHSKAVFVTNYDEYHSMKKLILNDKRTLPVIVALQQSDAPSDEDTKDYRDGYDMKTFSVNGTRIAKVTGYYSHVYMVDKLLLPDFAKDNDIHTSDADGSICIFWPLSYSRSNSLYTRQMICDTHFDFNRFAFHDDNINEKAFRHKLVQIIKDDNVSH